MRTAIAMILVISAFSFGEQPRELPRIEVSEWGFLVWSEGEALLASGTPGIIPFPTVPDEMHPEVRAPVLYFNGPEFTGTVTVETDNGTVFDIYPPVPDGHLTENRVTWTAEFVYDRDAAFSDGFGVAPCEWNHEDWRVEHSMVVRCDNGWHEKFLYYETAPETTGFLPYSPGVESIVDEYRGVSAILLKRGGEGVHYAQCTLGDLVYGGDISYTDAHPDEIMSVFYQWSVNMIDPDMVNALWRTWSGWILRDHVNEPAYGLGMVIYMIPEELTEKLSTITVTPDPSGPDYQVDISRYLLVAVPL